MLLVNYNHYLSYSRFKQREVLIKSTISKSVSTANNSFDYVMRIGQAMGKLAGPRFTLSCLNSSDGGVARIKCLQMHSSKKKTLK